MSCFKLIDQLGTITTFSTIRICSALNSGLISLQMEADFNQAETGFKKWMNLVSFSLGDIGVVSHRYLSFLQVLRGVDIAVCLSCIDCELCFRVEFRTQNRVGRKSVI